jgi:hypothetical protein
MHYKQDHARSNLAESNQPLLLAFARLVALRQSAWVVESDGSRLEIDAVFEQGSAGSSARRTQTPFLAACGKTIRCTYTCQYRRKERTRTPPAALS